MKSTLMFLTLSLFAVVHCDFAVADVALSRGYAAMVGNMEGVDRKGRAYSVYRLGRIDTRKSTLEVFAVWSSAKRAHTTLFGEGWCVPVLDSRMYPIGVDTYEMLRADGRVCVYRKVSGKKGVFTGDLSDTAVVRPGEIRVYWGTNISDKADMVFRNGRLSSLRVNKSLLEYRYDANGSVKVICDGKEACRAEVSGKESRTSRIVFANGNEIQFSMGEVPVCVGIAEGRVKVVPAWTLAELQYIGKKLSFSYGSDSNGHGRFFDGTQTFSWNPENRCIAALNDWTYNIKPPKHGNNVHYYRKHKNGEVEEYYVDLQSGTRIKEVRKCREEGRVFTSGRLRGKLRWNDKTRADGDGERIEYSYNENGRLVYYKSIDHKSQQVAESWFDQNGRILRSRSGMDDKTTLEYIYTSDGMRAAVVCAHDGKITSHNVENVEAFVKWHNDRKMGIDRPAPKIAQRAFDIPVIDVSKGKLGL